MAKGVHAEEARAFSARLKQALEAAGVRPSPAVGAALAARKLGRPELEVETKDGRISRVNVLRGSPCGATWHAATGIVGKKVDEAAAMTGLFCQQYPCRAVRGTGREAR